MRRTVPLVVAVATLAALAGEARADFRGAKQKFLHGDYAGARADLAEIHGRSRDRARLLLAELDIRTGRYDAAEKTSRTLASSAASAAIATRAHVVHAQVLRITGRYGEAIHELRPIARRPKQYRARYLLAATLEQLGKNKQAKKLFQSFFADWNSGAISQNDASAIMYVALAGRYLSAYQDANDMFREAVNRDPNLLEANIDWGYLFLEKYAAGYAEQSFDEVLKIDPHNPDAHAGMARVKLEQNYDLAGARHHLKQALAANPHHVPSLLIRAGIEIDQNRWKAAKATLDQVFSVNPVNLKALSLLATIDYLRGNTAAYQAEKRRVFALNGGYARFYRIVARSAVREHRYVEAIGLEKDALQVNRNDYEAMQALGTGYLRLGEEKEGLVWLRRSWKGDQYNVRTLNLLNLFEKVIPKQYSFVRTKHFKILYQNDEKAILSRYVDPLLERAFKSMQRRYGFTPKTPITVELFRNPDHYSVRTIGLPNLGALGVCFGRVITAVSPTNGDINWGMVLWHELGHVFAIQLSHSRVPRWYTEGLSEYETVMARPEWHRENDADLWAALQDGTLPSVADYNAGFLKPDMQKVVVAYYLSSVTIEYIAHTYGFDKIVEGLKLYGKGMETPAVLDKITGLTVPEFDTAFRAYLRKRLAPYAGTFHVPTTGYDDVKKLEIAAAAHPDDARAQAGLALGYFFDADAEEAQTAAAKALKLDPNDKIALYVTAELAFHNHDLDRAAKQYRALIAAGGDGFAARARLGWIYAKKGDVAEAEKQLCMAEKLDPERSYPYQVLAELYTKVGRDKDALEALENFVMLEQMQYAPAKRLVDAYAKRGDWNKVRTYGELALHINPDNSDLLLKLGRAYLETGAPARALYTYASALVVKPGMRRPALAYIGRARAFAAEHRRRDALAAVKRALAVEPENAAALALRTKLSGHR